ncbi:MAG TPA: MFS transporter [Propionibacteriaceae bacterium]|nr:MFS transporter [Propionibacteriaceae bacterium]
MTVTTVVDPVRVSRARIATLAVFAVQGAMFSAWASRIPDVKARLDLTPGQLGIVLLAVSVGSLLGLPTSGRIAHAVGVKRAVQLAAIVNAGGAVIVGIGIDLVPSRAVVMAGLFVWGLGAGVWDVNQNVEGTAVEHAMGRAIMPWFHAAWSGGTVVMAFIGAGLAAAKVPVVAHLTGAALLVLVIAFWGTARFLPATAADSADELTAHELLPRSAWTEGRTLLIGVMVFAAAFAEGTANDWIAVAFIDGHNQPAWAGVLALAVFLTFMTAGRVFGTVLLDRHGRVPVLRILFVLASIGCRMVLFGGVFGAYVGAAIWGLGASMGFPVGMSAAGDDPRYAPQRISVVATIGYTAFLSGPPLLGFLGDRVGVLRALLAVGVMGIFALLVVSAAKPLPGAMADRGQR